VIEESPALSCFTSDGELAPDEVPCDRTAPVSACCQSTEYCVANLYCWSGGDAKRAPGACTDASWDDPACGCPCENLAFLPGSRLVLELTANKSG
jgi:hypothetical protein